MNNEIKQQAYTAAKELITVGRLQAGDLLVVGCSSSEILAAKIGTSSAPEIGLAVAEGILDACREAGVQFMQGRVTAIHAEDGAVSGVRVGNKDIAAYAVILATGGCSYPVTGSDGNGYRLAERLGHTIVQPRPSLVPLVCEGDLCRRMMGLSLRNVSLRLDGGVKTYDPEVPDKAPEYPEVYVYGRILPAKGIFFRHIDGLTLENVTVRTFRPDVREDFVFADVNNIKRG